MDFPLPKRCADIRRGGVGEHGGGKRRHSSTARRARRVEEWRRLPPPCQAQPHLPPFVCVIKCRFPSQAASHLLGNGKTIHVAHDGRDVYSSGGACLRHAPPCRLDAYGVQFIAPLRMIKKPVTKGRLSQLRQHISCVRRGHYIW